METAARFVSSSKSVNRRLHIAGESATSMTERSDRSPACAQRNGDGRARLQFANHFEQVAGSDFFEELDVHIVDDDRLAVSQGGGNCGSVAPIVCVTPDETVHQTRLLRIGVNGRDGL